MCPAHGDEIKAAVKLHGLWGFVSKNEHVLLARIALERDGDPDPKLFDPLLNVMFNIFAQAVHKAPILVRMADACPLCEVDAAGGSAKNWIDGATLEAVAYARHHGLIPKPS